MGQDRRDRAKVVAIQGLANAPTALDAAQATAKDAKSAFDAEQAKVGPVLRAYRKQLYTTYGNAAQLADYGLTPHKARTPPTAEQRALAVHKLRATRKARGTTSEKQKVLANLHGQDFPKEVLLEAVA